MEGAGSNLLGQGIPHDFNVSSRIRIVLHTQPSTNILRIEQYSTTLDQCHDKIGGGGKELGANIVL